MVKADRNPSPPLIAIFGAGSIGCYLGGRLAATGSTVRFIGRERVAKTLRTEGVRLTDHRGTYLSVPPEKVDFATDPSALADASLILVTVKANDTEETGRILAAHSPVDATIISFQNGIGNEDILRGLLPNRTVLPGMVPFNVVQLPDSTYKQASDGMLDVERDPKLIPYAAAFERAGLNLRQHKEFRPIQWGKLLLNLNNAISGLSGLSLREELSQRPYRQCLAMAQRELLAALSAAEIKPAALTPLAPGMVPFLLSLPNWIFLRVANSMLAIDPAARSSMIDALDAGKRTDVDYLNGEVVRLAEAHDLTAPANARLVQLIHESEASSRRRWSGEELLAELRSAQS